MSLRWTLASLPAVLLFCCATAGAQQSGRLLATSGVSQVDGAAGGGLVPWSVITGYGTRDGIGANIHDSFAYLTDFSINSAGASLGLYDRLELSYAHDWLDTRQAGARLGLGEGFQLHLDTVGLKLRLAGDVVYDQDSWLPQVAIGAQYKYADRQALIHAIGARDSSGVDVYVAATKLFLAQSLLVDVTARATRANQFGLLGFGGDRNDGYRPAFEGSAALLLTRKLAVGAELRTKPDNLRFAHEGAAGDVFAAYFIDRNVSVTLAYLNLGGIVRQSTQDGVYLSLQAGF